MMINHTTEAVRTSSATPVESRPKSGVSSRSSNSASESVQLSSASLQSHATEAPFNAEKVESIKLAIRSGAFSINANAIAEKLLQIEHDFAAK